MNLAWQLGIKLIGLPKRAPELNLMDHLWGDAKDAISADKQYATIDDQVFRFLRYMTTLSPWAALHKAAVLSPKFWLRTALSKTFCGSA